MPIQIYSQREILSVATSQFTAEIGADDPHDSESIDFPADWNTAGVNKVLIHDVSIASEELLPWQISLYGNSTQSTSNYTLNQFVTSVAFSTANITVNNGSYNYENEADFRAPIFYEDKDKTSKLHVTLTNTSDTSKTINAAGEIKIRFLCEPLY